jgi:hypothetical protein
MMGSNVLKRAALAGVLLALGMSAGCSSARNSADEPAPAPPQSSGPQIESPNDAAALDPCALLPQEGAQAAGLAPAGRKVEDPVDPEGPTGCAWDFPGKVGEGVTLTPMNDRSIQEYFQNRATYQDFQELTIANHPAARANNGDPAADGMCDVFLGTKDGQVLASQVNIDPASGVDPCGLAQEALEASVPNLPAAK